jgi:hypothetical protein
LPFPTYRVMLISRAARRRGPPSASTPGYHPPRRRPRRSRRRAARAVFSSSSGSHPRMSTPTLHPALRAPLRRAPGPPITHPLRRTSISRTSVPAAAAASTLALATSMPTLVEPLPHGEAAPPSAPHVHIVSPACRGYITPPARSPHPLMALLLRYYSPPTFLPHLRRGQHRHRR